MVRKNTELAPLSTYLFAKGSDELRLAPEVFDLLGVSK
jgi:hypothetical protein